MSESGALLLCGGSEQGSASFIGSRPIALGLLHFTYLTQLISYSTSDSLLTRLLQTLHKTTPLSKVGPPLVVLLSSPARCPHK